MFNAFLQAIVWRRGYDIAPISGYANRNVGTQESFSKLVQRSRRFPRPTGIICIESTGERARRSRCRRRLANFDLVTTHEHIRYWRGRFSSWIPHKQTDIPSPLCTIERRQCGKGTHDPMFWRRSRAWQSWLGDIVLLTRWRILFSYWFGSKNTNRRNHQ